MRHASRTGRGAQITTAASPHLRAVMGSSPKCQRVAFAFGVGGGETLGVALKLCAVMVLRWCCAGTNSCDLDHTPTMVRRLKAEAMAWPAAPDMASATRR